MLWLDTQWKVESKSRISLFMLLLNFTFYAIALLVQKGKRKILDWTPQSSGGANFTRFSQLQARNDGNAILRILICFDCPTFSYQPNEEKHKYIPDMEGAEAICIGREQSHWVELSIKQPANATQTPERSKEKENFKAREQNRKACTASVLLSWESKRFLLNFQSESVALCMRNVRFQTNKLRIKTENLAKRDNLGGEREREGGRGERDIKLSHGHTMPFDKDIFYLII